MNIKYDSWEECAKDKASCLNCTHEGGGCARNSQVNRQQRNGMYYRNGEVVGIIVCCMNYTGPYADWK